MLTPEQRQEIRERAEAPVTPLQRHNPLIRLVWDASRARTDIPALLDSLDEADADIRLLRTSYAEADKRIAELEAAIGPLRPGTPSLAVRLNELAEWIDILYPNDWQPEMQQDLRRWARRLVGEE